MLNPEFIPRAMKELEPVVRPMVQSLIDGFIDRAECDFHADFATPVPSNFFLALLGLPLSDLPQFLRWRDEYIRPDVPSGDFEAANAVRAEASRKLTEYFRIAIAERRERPDDALLSRLVHSDHEMSDDELLGMSNLLLLAGLDTVTSSLDCIVAYFAKEPARRREVVADPSLLPRAIEELLRRETPVMIVPRIMKQDVEIHGRQLTAGDSVMLVLGAANSDECEFSGPTVDFARNPNRHLAFGGGPHLCLGIHLARVELRVALEEFHLRIPDYRLKDGTDIHFSPGIRLADRLLLEWDRPG